ncbi:MAG: hypothetical protein IID35_10320, partial [Planctomycetes bacterium]|nr:hypothetical protein [Planctomycetota bacterium]
MRLPFVLAFQMIVAATASAEIPEAKAVAAKGSVIGVPDVLSLGLARVYPVPRGTFFQRHVVDDATSGVAVGVERRIYSNTEGRVFAALGGGRPVADDITTTAPHNTVLGRYTFQVTGKANPAGQGGPYSVEFALYNQCPQSVRSADRPGLVVPGTAGIANFPDDAPRQIELVVPGDVTARLPTNFFLGVKLSHDNVGILMGAPAFEGHSDDSWDFPPFACASHLGGFPERPHASFNAEIFDRDGSVETHLEYKAQRSSGPTFNPGADVWLVDDLELLTPDCDIVGYEVAIKGAAVYDFEFREACDGGPIPGTKHTLKNAEEGLRLYRVSFNGAVGLPQEPWFAVRVDNEAGGTIVAGTRPTIGDSENFFGVINAEGACELGSVGTGIRASLHLTVTCAGGSPKGACCDMVLVDKDGEAVCRQLPEINCPFPPRDSDLLPRWSEGNSCDADPFPFSCGVAACCKPDDICENLTFNECNAVPPIDIPREWQRGIFCGDMGQACPFNACLRDAGDCAQAHTDAGCSDSDCCPRVCAADHWCCQVAWDTVCVREELTLCSDETWADRCSTALAGVTEIASDSSVVVDTSSARLESTEPRPVCALPRDSALGGTVWFKFRATTGSARIHTCNTSPPADDTIVTVYRAGDPSTDDTACATLIEIACNDDFCSLRSRLTLSGLTPGQTYYVQFASFEPIDQGFYKLRYESPAPIPPPEDICAGAIELTVPPGGLDFAGGPTDTATVDIDSPACAFNPITAPGIWFKVQGTGEEMTAALCNSSFLFDTKMNVYCGSSCDDLVCVANSDDDCDFNARITWCSEVGQTYYILTFGFDGAVGDINIIITSNGTPCADSPDCTTCTLVCPPGAILEAEPCGELLNDGCNLPVPAFEPLQCGDIVCGNAAGVSSTRDTDWYEFVLDTQSIVTWSVQAELPVELFILDDTCDPQPTNLAQIIVPRCETGQVQAILDPGTYRLFVANVLDAFPCGTSNLYIAQLTCEPIGA